MSKKNPEYDFKWCPGCGDFGVRRSLEMAMNQWMVKTEMPIERNVVVAGIGCSGNTVHLLEGQQPYGFHGIHGRSLPLAMGVKMGNPELNVIVVAGDGDFLSIGAEHIGPQAARNLNVCAVIMDNGVYGLTKGQSSPTTAEGVVTSSTPYGKIEAQINPLHLYITLGVSFIASSFSSKVRDMASLSPPGHGTPRLRHRPRAVTVHHLQQHLRRPEGRPGQGNRPGHLRCAGRARPRGSLRCHCHGRRAGPALGLIYQDPNSVPLDQRMAKATVNARTRRAEDIFDTLAI